MSMVDIDPQPLTDWLLLFLAITGAITAVITLYARAARARSRAATQQRNEMINLIKETTKQIQPDANGSLSLTDLHKKVDRIEHTYEIRHEKELASQELWHEKYLEDQRRIRKEWTAVFVAIRRMISLPPEKQMQMWDNITEAYIDGTIADKVSTERKSDDG